MGLTVTGERTRSYVVDPSVPLPGLPPAAGIERVRARPTTLLHEELLDTPDRVLAAHGVVLRHTLTGPDAGFSVEVPHGDAALMLRHDEDSDSAVPGEVLDVLQAFLRGRVPAPVAARVVRRSPVELVDADGHETATFHDDVVAATSAHDHATKSTREWALTSGDHRVLDALDEIVRDAGGQRAGSSTDPATSGSLTGARRAEATGRADPAWSDLEAVLGVALRAQLDVLLGWDPLVRLDVDDSVHRLRVATRTLRSILQVYAPLLAPGPTGKVTRILRDLGRLLADARDAEVLRDAVDDRLGALPGGAHGAVADLVPGRTVRRLRRTKGADYRSAHRELLRGLSGPRYWAVLDQLENYGRRVPLRADPSMPEDPDVAQAPHVTARPSLSAATGRDDLAGTLTRLGITQIDAIADRARDEPDPKTRRELFHDVRKAAKRLRYATGAVERATGTEIDPELTRLVRDASSVQKRLGTYRDSVMFQEHLLACARKAKRKGEDTFGYGLLYAAELDIEERALRKAEDRLARLTGTGGTRR